MIMSTVNHASLQERLQNALSNPSVTFRCQETSQIILDVNIKDATTVLRSIVESIFGVLPEISHSTSSSSFQQNIEGWGLRIITITEHMAEFQAIRTFLSPTGPLLNFIYKLSQDPFNVIPFPISLLPSKLRSQIERGTSSSFYTNKIQNAGPGKSPVNILFNPFEFYMFHFGYFLTCERGLGWNILWASIKDSIYPTLLEDYLSSYLPCGASIPPGPSIFPGNPRGLLSPVNQRANPSNHPPNFSVLVSPIAAPFRSYEQAAHIGLRSYGTTGYQTSSPIHSSSTSQTEVSTWTSQSFVQVIMEVWINFCVPTSDVNSLSYQTLSAPSNCNSGRSMHPSLEDVFVPNADHVRAVRMVVKHFHYFSNSIKPQYPSPLDPLRKNLWVMCRKGVYFFIKHLFIHWPLDSSFRIGLESWLSYIQPWRYLNYNKSDRSPDFAETEVSRSVDSKWTGFVAQNLLFYTLLFRLLVKRLLKLDMGSSKNAQIMFRVAKVFSQENLVSIIGQLEQLLEANQIQKFMGGYLSSSPSFVSQEATDSQLMLPQIVQMVRSHIAEVEKPQHDYMPLLGGETLRDVYQLIQISVLVKNNLETELSLNAGTSEVTNKSPETWFTIFRNAFFDNQEGKEEENTLEEMRKCVSHLEVAVAHLCSIFDISLPHIPSIDSLVHRRLRNASGSGDLSGTPEKARVPDQTVTADGPQLTDYGRQQLMNGLRRLDLKYEGDPDLRPIGDSEVRFLVRILFKCSQWLNLKYEAQLNRCYHQETYLGSLSRLILQPPQTVYEYKRNISDSDQSLRKRARNLPPRLSFRSLAQKKIIVYVLFIYVAMWLCGFTTPQTTLQFVFPFLLTYFLVRAALNHHTLTPTFLHRLNSSNQ